MNKILIIIIGLLASNTSLAKFKMIWGEKKSKNLALLLSFLFASNVWAGEWVKDTNQCNIWIPSPIKNEMVKWDGQCIKGYAQGGGFVQWFKDHKETSKEFGVAIKGIFDPNLLCYFPVVKINRFSDELKFKEIKK